ncbi:hypothetical protein PAXINDRAFT_15301 [Paxillus involutus ATCC 200175]|uniref:Uncharacterized protein n=1 Tax=Paxillus involutus ATCC 200175 TaxID=664439 RepID=A0A0C9TMN3_PAXIN|nr:hypothetical protein PAXINDRAFT_15301 [Paxillus involutus ATCC 200175]
MQAERPQPPTNIKLDIETYPSSKPGEIGCLPIALSLCLLLPPYLLKIRLPAYISSGQC